MEHITFISSNYLNGVAILNTDCLQNLLETLKSCSRYKLGDYTKIQQCFTVRLDVWSWGKSARRKATCTVINLPATKWQTGFKN